METQPHDYRDALSFPLHAYDPRTDGRLYGRYHIRGTNQDGTPLRGAYDDVDEAACEGEASAGYTRAPVVLVDAWLGVVLATFGGEAG